tara:strand:- start:115 stop:372 length:258 start_codon:yes stop_codon:yes gene_type:complete
VASLKVPTLLVKKQEGKSGKRKKKERQQNGVGKLLQLLHVAEERLHAGEVAQVAPLPGVQVAAAVEDSVEVDSVEVVQHLAGSSY